MKLILSFIMGLLRGLGGLLAAYFAGDLNRQKKQAEKTIESIRDVRKIHDTIERDPAARSRLRDKYK